jgi:enoyl-CoA hydratase/carnithine racemase
MERDVRHAMEAAAGDDGVRVIVLTGAGRAFCAGADMEALQAIDPSEIRRGENTPSFDMNRRADWQTRYAYYPAIPKARDRHAERRHRRHRPRSMRSIATCALPPTTPSSPPRSRAAG